ncbi:MAG: putative sugar O-methyltransferase [Candidatus Omnitrophica bacterium]|nr:putative sugar O-methyltransferase [Candidatus Omnitrophota bacterium]MCM8790595.1 putative sugar O-methyltransferase [Candidatus Omnitrophota bacterium]
MKLNIYKLPEPKIISEIFNRYYGREDTDKRFVSSHWKYHSSRIRVSIDYNGNVRVLRGSGFGLMDNTHIFNKIVHMICNNSYLITLPDRFAIKNLMKLSSDLLKAVDSYLSYESFRQLCSLNVILKHFNADKRDSIAVLMIGDGYGFLSAMIKVLYPRSTIVLVDIGKVLLFQAIYLQRIFRQARHHLVFSPENATCSTGRYDFVYCPSENIEALNDIRFGLIVNIASMQEMDYKTIMRYFAYMRSHVVDGALFYCLNRVKKELPGGEVIEFEKYPWNRNDVHLVDEECAFYRYYLSLRPPFFHRFEGPFRHRVTVLCQK